MNFGWNSNSQTYVIFLICVQIFGMIFLFFSSWSKNIVSLASQWVIVYISISTGYCHIPCKQVILVVFFETKNGQKVFLKRKQKQYNQQFTNLKSNTIIYLRPHLHFKYFLVLCILRREKKQIFCAWDRWLFCAWNEWKKKWLCAHWLTIKLLSIR